MLDQLQAFADSPFFQTYGLVVVRLLLIVVLTLVALRLGALAVRGAVRALFEREASEGTAQELSAIEIGKRRETVAALGQGVVRGFIFVVAFLVGMETLGLDIGPAIAGLGIAGLALGLGSQSLVRDYLAGTFILVENQYGKGDVIRIVDVTGTVEDFTLRRTTLRDFDGTVHTVPNGLIGVSSNLTRLWARVDVEITVAAADLERASRLVDEIGAAMAEDAAWKTRVLEAPRVDRIAALTASGVTLKILGSVRADDRWAAAGELRRRILAAFSANEVSLAD
ncbi:MAG: mechanosensitive ion channel family protein [Chloroflexi bacterium]|nr:mechanosensitive ion channel family protein [Chloroflexota bacterium]